MSVGIGNEAAQFHLKKNLNRIFSTVHIDVAQQGVEILRGPRMRQQGELPT